MGEMERDNKEILEGEKEKATMWWKGATSGATEAVTKEKEEIKTCLLSVYFVQLQKVAFKVMIRFL